jgi:hypothetical protein
MAGDMARQGGSGSGLVVGAGTGVAVFHRRLMNETFETGRARRSRGLRH